MNGSSGPASVPWVMGPTVIKPYKIYWSGSSDLNDAPDETDHLQMPLHDNIRGEGYYQWAFYHHKK